MLSLLAAQFISRVLRNAGQIPPDMEAIEEPTESPVPNN
jgi:hypothetical protein